MIVYRRVANDETLPFEPDFQQAYVVRTCQCNSATSLSVAQIATEYTPTRPVRSTPCWLNVIAKGILVRNGDLDV